MKSVVVTGLGAVTPLGTGVKKTWDQALKGVSGIGKIKSFPVDSMPVQIAGEITDINIDDWIPKKDQKKQGRFIHIAMASAKQAIEQSGLDFANDSQLQKQTGVLMGVGMGALPDMEDSIRNLNNNKRISPFFIPSIIANSASGQMSIQWGLKGPNFSTVSACASGAHAIGEAFRWIQAGRCEVVLAGGAESVLSPISFYGFHAMRALSTRNEVPEKASRPWDKDRDGFILSEGAAVLVLEEEQRAKKRKAPILAKLTGYGASSDAHHIAAPHPEGAGAGLAMELALQSAAVNKEDVSYINAHGTSTPAGDKVEALAVQSVFKEHSSQLWMSSTKSMTGHTLGAAGAVESVFSVLSLKDQAVPPTINLDEPEEGMPALDFVPHQAREGKINVVLNNSFGFGGTNVCLIFEKYR